MSEPIDLDLIKLRATVRGWRFEQFDDPEQIHIECKYGGWIVYQTGRLPRREHPWGNFSAHKRIEATLTAPRWTLDRLLSEPPEGWTYDKDDDSLVYGLDQETNEYDIAFLLERDEGAVSWRLLAADICLGREDLASLGRELKAAAELAHILAEIQP